MASSDFWQELAEQFRSINNAWSIRADWDNTAGEMGFGYWVLTGETAGILNFKALAARGAREIIDTKVSDLFSAWLDKLKLESFGFKSTRFEITQNPDGSELEQCVTGCIPYVCEESAKWGICLTQVTPIRCGSRLPKPVPRPPDAPCLAQNGVLKGPGYENAFESFSLLCCFAGPIQAPACPIWRH